MLRCIGSDVTCFRCRISNHFNDTCVDITQVGVGESRVRGGDIQSNWIDELTSRERTHSVPALNAYVESVRIVRLYSDLR